MTASQQSGMNMSAVFTFMPIRTNPDIAITQMPQVSPARVGPE